MKRLPTFLRTDEAAALLKAAEFEGDREAALVLLGMYLGLRVSELVSVRAEDVDLRDRTVRTRGKGDRDGVVPIPSVALKALAEWVGEQREGWLFPSSRSASGHLTPRQVQRIVQRLRARAGVARRCTPHTLRHTYGTKLIRSGAHIYDVARLMRHASIKTTEIYLHATADDLRAAAERLT